MSPEKKQWTKPRAQSVDQSAFKHWDREKLLKVRDLVQGALELVERSGRAHDAATSIRAALDEIERELAK